MTPPASGSRWLARGLDLALYVALPLVGLLVLGWDWRPIVLLYWLENITVGGVTFIGLIRARIARRAAGNPVGSAGMHPAFFLVHYGLFTFVHGVFVGVLVMIPTALAPASPMTFAPASAEPVPFGLLVLAWAATTVVQWVLASVTKTPQPGGVGRAYARIFALHLAILGGVWLIISLGLPAIVAIVLVVLHAIADAVMFSMERGVASGKWKVTRTSPGEWEFTRVSDELP